jgi:hypothetical protein
MPGRFTSPRTWLVAASVFLLLGIGLALSADTMATKVGLVVLTLCYSLPTIRWSIRRIRSLEGGAPQAKG